MRIASPDTTRQPGETVRGALSLAAAALGLVAAVAVTAAVGTGPGALTALAVLLLHAVPGWWRRTRVQVRVLRLVGRRAPRPLRPRAGTATGPLDGPPRVAEAA